MNNYQKRAFESFTSYLLASEELNTCNGIKLEEDGRFVLTQNENINIVKYQFIVSETQANSSPINKVFYKKDGKWIESKHLTEKTCNLKFEKFIEAVKQGLRVFKIDLDFNDRIEAIRFEYKFNIVEPVEVDIEYHEADKDRYYKKVAAEERQSLINAAQLRVATGADLVNVYFQPCNDNYGSTVIELYSITGGATLLGKFKVEEGMFFKSITGLAYGSYKVIVSQLDKEGKQLFKSDDMPFVIGNGGYGSRRF